MSFIKHAGLYLTLFFIWACSHATPPNEGNYKQSNADSVASIDYINYKYKYLDGNLRLRISPENFSQAMRQYKFLPERIKTHSDSLSVVLMWEFNNWQIADIAKRRILFSWERLGYYLYRDEKSLKTLAGKLNYLHPYLVYAFFKSDSTNKLKRKELNRLRDTISVITHRPRKEFVALTNNQLLNLCFKNNEKVLKLRNTAEANHRHATTEIETRTR